MEYDSYDEFISRNNKKRLNQNLEKIEAFEYGEEIRRRRRLKTIKIQ